MPFFDSGYPIQNVGISRWQVDSADGKSRFSSHLAVCTGANAGNLRTPFAFDLTPARGQISRFELPSGNPGLQDQNRLKAVVSGKHYAIPDSNSLIVGASFQRGDDCPDVRPEDDDENYLALKTLLPSITTRLTRVESFAGVRATTPDRLPIVGPIHAADACHDVYGDLQHGRNIASYPALPVHQGAYALGGLGFRGIVTAPFAALLLADYMMGGEELPPNASGVEKVAHLPAKNA